MPRGQHGGVRPDGARITRVLVGHVHLLHTPNQSLCGVLNEYVQPRQVLMVRTGRDAKNRSILRYDHHLLQSSCIEKLQEESGYCLLPSAAPHAITDAPSIGSMSASARGMEPEEDFVKAAELQPLAHFVNECRRRNAACKDMSVDEPRPRMNAQGPRLIQHSGL